MSCIETKNSLNGIFWLINNEIISFPYSGDAIGVAKSGTTYNHKKLWKESGIIPDKAYNYFPRGRVHVNNKGTAIIYINPNIGKEYLQVIRNEFHILDKYKVKYDFSEHYRCYLDEGWKPDW